MGNKKILSGQREIILRVLSFFEEEKKRGLFVVPVDRVLERTIKATGVSRSTITRLKREREKELRLQKEKDAGSPFKWHYCALSQQPLQEPIVACRLGRLYSKSSVLEALEKETKPESIEHIESIEDVKSLKLTKNPAYKDTDQSEAAVGGGKAPYICPSSGLEISKIRSVFLWECGCVLAESTLKKVKQQLCSVCKRRYSYNDLIILNGTDEDIEKLKKKMIARAATKKVSKPSKVDKAEKEKPVIKLEPVSTSTSVTKVSLEPNVMIEENEGEEETEAGSSIAIKKEIATIPSSPKCNSNNQVISDFESSKRMHLIDSAQDLTHKKIKTEIAKNPQASEERKSDFYASFSYLHFTKLTKAKRC